MLSMKDDSGVIFINDKSRNVGDLMHYVCSCIWGIPLFHHEGTDAYIQWQDNDRYVLHNAAMTVTNSNGCPAWGASQCMLAQQVRWPSGVRTDW